MDNSKKVFLNAIKQGGSTIRDFKNISGKSGGFQKSFNVYQRANLNCKRSAITKIMSSVIIDRALNKRKEEENLKYFLK